ncbi:MAG: hypothetical protein K6E76_03295 [Patescibacteria group bacterium]|nr:hypothetical protein [Patescibacteria group bacterium]
MVESAISSQYASSSIEKIARPKFFTKKYYDIEVLEPENDPLYTIKLYKNIPDDPINNILDSIGKVSTEDTVNIIFTTKPEGDWFNKKRQVAADRLYKNLDLYETKRWKKLLNPLNWFSFVLHGPSKELLTSKKEEDNVTMVRMVKSKEDSRNAMGEEAANPTFHCTITMIAGSDVEERPKQILNNLEGAYNIYKDEYSNALVVSNQKHDIFGAIFKPLRSIGARLFLTGFFSDYCYFSTNELTSLFHFPDGTYNRSPGIEWMQYKVVAPPPNLPMFSDDGRNGHIISGVLAESYKKGNLSAILKDYENHWAVGTRKDIVEEFKPVSQCTKEELEGQEVVEHKGEQCIKLTKEKLVRGYKVYKG